MIYNVFAIIKGMFAGQIIRDARRRKGLSQGRLALRAGTRQSAISRLERGQVSPSIETMELLLNVMGETLDLTAQPLARRFDPLHLKASKARTPEERLALAISWNRTAGRLAEAGRTARAGQV